MPSLALWMRPFGAALLLAAPLALAAQDAARPPATVGAPLPSWTPGTLDIHQISTGRGNSALIILPDRTTLMVDAGAVGDGIPESAPHPDGSRTPGEWIARYVTRHIPDSAAGLDYAMLTHFHSDHMGQLLPGSPLAPGGAYRMTGITEVGARVRIHTMLDRGWPDYAFPVPLTDSAVANYRAFLAAERTRGTSVERFRPGAHDQIRQRHDASRWPGVEVRNIVGNGELWTGRGDSARSIFPPLASTPRADWPDENMCSLGIRITYGRFRFFTGGDLPGTPDPGFPAWQAMEGVIAGAIGPVDAHVLTHHGSIGAESEPFLRTLASTVLIIPAWSTSHPGPDVLKRIVNSRFAPAERFIFATDFRDATRIVIGQRANALAAPTGHVVLRVEPGGARYWVIVVSNRDERDTVLAVKGPFIARDGR